MYIPVPPPPVLGQNAGLGAASKRDWRRAPAIHGDDRDTWKEKLQRGKIQSTARSAASAACATAEWTNTGVESPRHDNSTMLPARRSFRQCARPPFGIWLLLIAGCSEEADLGTAPKSPGATGVDAAANEIDPRDGGAHVPATSDAGTSLPGEPFTFALTGNVYLALAGPSVLSGSDRTRSDWDLYFDGLTAYTNGGVAGPGEGASFGPSSALDLLFDTAPAVPMRADLSDGAFSSWYWFAEGGIISRFRVYGVRDSDGRFFKVQVLSYYADGVDGADRAEGGVYAIRFAEVTDGSNGETIELNGIDARAGGVTIPVGSTAGCVDLASGTRYALTKREWLSRSDWHLCFQRTEIFVNGGLSGSAGVVAVDLEQDPSTTGTPTVSSDEAHRTADGERERFDAIGHAELTNPALPWERTYSVRARIGNSWLSSDGREPLAASWIVRGADGKRHYALYFTDFRGGENVQVQVQVKALE